MTKLDEQLEQAVRENKGRTSKLKKELKTIRASAGGSLSGSGSAGRP